MWVELLRKQMSLKKTTKKPKPLKEWMGVSCCCNEPLQVHGFSGSGMENKPETNLNYPLPSPSFPMPIQVCVCPVHPYFQIALRPDSAECYLAII